MVYPQTFKTIFRFSASTGRLTGIIWGDPLSEKWTLPWT